MSRKDYILIAEVLRVNTSELACVTKTSQWKTATQWAPSGTLPSQWRIRCAVTIPDSTASIF